MAAREQSLVIASPFKTGFFVGLGFFFASIFLSLLGFIIVALLGLGTIAGAWFHQPTALDRPLAAPTAAHHAAASNLDNQ
jgi:hypothetical protein